MWNTSAPDEKEVVGKVVLCDHSIRVNISTQVKELERNQLFANPIRNTPNIVLTTAKGILVKDYAERVCTNAKLRSMRIGLTRLGTKPAPQVSFDLQEDQTP